jgi:hypothetical protein
VVAIEARRRSIRRIAAAYRDVEFDQLSISIKWQSDMMIELQTDRDLKAQAAAAGFSTVEDYLLSLIDRDAERVAIQEGIDAMRAGDMRPLEEFDAELRRKFGFAPRT